MNGAKPLTASLSVDYSNGNRKHFSRLQLFSPADVADVLAAAKASTPGLDFTFTRSFVDRGGNQVGAVTAVDGIENSDDQRWRVWLGPAEVTEIRAHVEGTVSSGGWTAITDGDVVVLKLTK